MAATPYMGWNTYYGVGGVFDERTIVDVADALVDRGLAAAGYRIVWLDYGWASGERDHDGELAIDPRQWPHGLDGLTAALHQRGLLAGIYSDGGRSGCEGRGVGSLGHYEQDADRFAAWGFDAVKVDFCGGGQERLDPVPLYREFCAALRHNASARPLIINVSNFWRPGHVGGGYPPRERSSHGNHSWAPRVADSWRTDTDIGFTRDVRFENVLRNYDANAAHPEAAGPGRFNDPDYLAPEIGLSENEARAQLTLWAVAAAPLIIGSDVRVLGEDSVAMLANAEVIAVDQDPLVAQATCRHRRGSGEAWVKPLADGGCAVAVLNRGTAPVQLSLSPRRLGLSRRDRHAVRDLWARAAAGGLEAIGAPVPGHSAALYRVQPEP